MCPEPHKPGECDNILAGLSACAAATCLMASMINDEVLRCGEASGGPEDTLLGEFPGRRQTFTSAHEMHVNSRSHTVQSMYHGVQRWKHCATPARGDVHWTLGGDQMIIDVSVTSPLSTSYVEVAAQCNGAAALKRDEAKTAACTGCAFEACI